MPPKADVHLECWSWSQHAKRRRWPHESIRGAALENYPHGRGYGHDYMRGGEVLGGYGYAERDEYSKARGELNGAGSIASDSSEHTGRPSPRTDTRT